MLFLFDVRQSLLAEVKTIVLCFLVLGTFVSGVNNSLFASISTDSIPYGISYPSGPFNADDSVTFKVWAGSQAEPLDTVAGFELTFTLTEYAVFPSSLTPDFTNSWVADGDEMSVSVELNPEFKTIRISAQRVSGSKDGYGELFSFTLVSAVNQITPDLMLDGAGGGIIITIGDVILRKSAPEIEELVDLLIYPNPTQGKVIISSEGPSVNDIQILDQWGRQVVQTDELALNLRQKGLVPGRYWLKIGLEGGMIISKLLIYSP
ncbi:MAG: T9SS type A sorting domain-containing protein [Bacteroidia bacterium]